MNFLSILFSWLFITSIYTLQYQDIDGVSQSMSQYEGKKILLVNIATGSSRVSQLGELQQLHQQYGDSLVIIAFPSNSFGHETRSDAEIKQFCQSNYNTTFRLAAKNGVAGTTIQPIYSWLAQVSENGAANAVVGADFQKFLIDKDGSLIGIYSPSVSPLDNTITNAITGN